jgi:hypothetical protein
VPGSREDLSGASYKDTDLIESAPIWPHLTLITLLEVLSPNIATLGIRTSAREYGANM